jgi:hypothetical protein
MEGHRLAQTVAYGDLGVELELERAGVRLGYLLNAAFGSE